ncbi:MAG: S-methyl-5'-thioinosine phosphorylase [Methylophilaceae bacterium]|jgi:5'-methylthioinosine phosphorylase|nr:S-methyl-5'-thioinosine phosphorylase [Methylophilaceae bacterium]
MIGIIGGTGLTQLANLEVVRRQIVRTPYGDASQPLIFGKIAGHDVVFLARHGGGHTISPHAINYRANIWALHSVGVTSLLAVATVGSIDTRLLPGDIVLPHQIIDYTHGRDSSYCDGIERPVMHIDFTHPYTESLRNICKQAAANIQQALHDGGVYACSQGPRLETAAEIDRFERDGADLVGMTGMPEAALARELGVDYAALCPIANHAAGRGDSQDHIHYELMMQHLGVTMEKVRGLISEIVTLHKKAEE